MSIIYLVTSGSYSDFSVERAFSTEAAVKEWIGVLTDQYGVQECELDGEQKKLTALLHVTMHFIDCKIQHNFIEGGDWADSALQVIRVCADYHRDPVFHMYFSHHDVERATKVVAEKRAQLLAAGSLKTGIYHRETLVYLGDLYSPKGALLKQYYEGVKP